MNKFWLIVMISIPHVIMSCNTEKISAVKSNSFKYYDLISLSGKESLNTNNFSYPNVHIDSSSERIAITHYITATDSFTSVYTKRGDWLQRKYNESLYSEGNENYEFIRNDSIVVILYNVASDSSISAIGVYSKGTFTCYCLYDILLRKEFLPDSAIAYVKNMKMGRLDKVTFFQKGDVLTIFSRSEYLEGMPPPTLRTYGDTSTGRRLYSTQYSIKNNGMPLDWWLIFKWKYYSSSFFLFEKKLTDLGVDPSKIVL